MKRHELPERFGFEHLVQFQIAEMLMHMSLPSADNHDAMTVQIEQKFREEMRREDSRSWVDTELVES